MQITNITIDITKKLLFPAVTRAKQIVFITFLTFISITGGLLVILYLAKEYSRLLYNITSTILCRRN